MGLINLKLSLGNVDIREGKGRDCLNLGKRTGQSRLVKCTMALNLGKGGEARKWERGQRL